MADATLGIWRRHPGPATIIARPTAAHGSRHWHDDLRDRAGQFLRTLAATNDDRPDLRVYVLGGRHEQRVNLSAQQSRALNLVWALKRRTRPGARRLTAAPGDRHRRWRGRVSPIDEAVIEKVFRSAIRFGPTTTFDLALAESAEFGEISELRRPG